MRTEAKRITTKKGDTMCFATVEDFTDSVEVTVFPRTFYQNMNLLVPDTPVVVQGRIDMTDESVKIIADSVWALKDYRFAYYIELPPGGLPETKREEMKQLIAAHHGAYATFFHSGGHWQKARENFWTRRRHSSGSSPSSARAKSGSAERALLREAGMDDRIRMICPSLEGK